MSSVRLVRENSTELHFAAAPLLGLLFFVVGIGVAYYGFNHPDDAAGRWVGLGAGSLFALIGGLGALWRYELTLDLMSRTYRGRRGFWPAPKHLEGSLDELVGVVIQRNWRRSSSKNGGSTEHVVWCLLLDFGEWSVRCYESRDESKAYARLEYFCKVLRADTIDRTGDEEVRRAWDELDRSIGDELRAGGERPIEPGTPPPRVVYDPSHGAARIVLPRLGFGAGTLFLLLFGGAFVAFALAFLLALSGVWDVPVSGSPTFAWIISCIFLAIGLFIMLGGLWASFAREVIREERDGLLFYYTLLGTRYRRRFIPRRLIEDIFLRDSTTSRSTHRARVRIGGVAIGLGGRTKAPRQAKELIVRSDEHMIELATGLGLEVQDWLLRALRFLAAR